MMLALALSGLLAGMQETQEEVYKRLALGDRVEITFTSGRTLTGKLVTPPQGEKADSMDFTKEKSLTLDLGVEYPGLSGTMTVRKDQVRSIRRLDRLSEKDLKRLEEERRRIEERRKSEQEKPPTPKIEPPPAPEPEKPAKDREAEEARKKAEELKKGEALYAKYAPPDWGPDRNTAIRLKKLRAAQLFPAEKEFHEGFELWDLYRREVVEAKKKPPEK